jgi:hypothetical protein
VSFCEMRIVCFQLPEEWLRIGWSHGVRKVDGLLCCDRLELVYQYRGKLKSMSEADN